MRALTAAETSALAARNLNFRNLVWLTAKNRSTGAPVSYGFWNGEATMNLSVIDALTQTAVTRTFAAAGTLLEVDDVDLTSDLQVRNCIITLSGVDTAIRQAVFTYDVRLAPIQVYRALLSTTSQLFISSARPRFVGFVDRASGVDPADDQQGTIQLSCVSQLREMMRSNPEVGSNESQERRKRGDKFFADVGAVSRWMIAWGQEGQKLGKDKHGNKKGKDDKGKGK